MKTFGKIKLFALSAILFLGMTSCLKSSDPGFRIGVSNAYIEQRGSGESATFTPMFQIYAYEGIQKANVSNTHNLSFYSYPLNTEKNVVDLVPMVPANTLPSGVYTISAVNAEQETASISLTFSVDKSLGAFTVNSLTYENGRIKASWEEAENAAYYCFLMREEGSRLWQVLDWNEGTIAAKKEGTFSLESLKAGKVLQVAAAAGYRNLIIVGQQRSIVIGTYDKEEETPAD